LGLRQVERVFTLDIARTHVVADGVADDFEFRRDYQSQLWFGDIPVAVGADADALAGAGNAVGRGLEEQLRSPRRVDEIIEPRRTSGFALAGFLRALVRDTRGPDFLLIDRCQQRDVAQAEAWRALVEPRRDDLGRMVGVQHVAKRLLRVEQLHVAVP